MNRMKRVMPMVGILFIVGVSGLVRFSQDVRTVHAVGLSGSGFSLGVGFAFVVMALTGRFRAPSAPGRE
ncbi:MAG TPA: hypothetical protein VE404_08460 [Verrucomicrobiae bacterium]|nr:hypothetical protein [Verrucomicrobiae bacterium]